MLRSIFCLTVHWHCKHFLFYVLKHQNYLFEIVILLVQAFLLFILLFIIYRDSFGHCCKKIYLFVKENLVRVIVVTLRSVFESPWDCFLLLIVSVTSRRYTGIKVFCITKNFCVEVTLCFWWFTTVFLVLDATLCDFKRKICLFCSTSFTVFFVSLILVCTLSVCF